MKQPVRCQYKILIALFLFFFLFVKTVSAETDKDIEKFANSKELLQSIENAALSEAGNLEELKARLGRLEILQKALFIEINAYNIQNAAHSNLLLQETTPTKDLKKALDDNQLTLKTIEDQIADFTKRRDSIQELLQQTQDQIDLNKKQESETKNSRWAQSEKAALLKGLNTLVQTRIEKQKVLQNLHNSLSTIVSQLEELRTSTHLLSEKLGQQIKRLTTRELFERKYIMAKVFKANTVAAEFSIFKANLGKLFQKDYWSSERLRIKESGSMPIMMLLLLLIVTGALIIRLRAYCLSYEKQPFVPTHQWRFLCVRLIRRSLFLMGAFLVFYSYNTIHIISLITAFIHPVLNLLLIFLISRWVLDFLKFWEPGENLSFIKALLPRIRLLTLSLLFLAAVYFVIMWTIGDDSIFLFLERSLIEIGLIAWCFRFWQAFQNSKQTLYDGPSPSTSIFQTILKVLLYFIIIGGLIIELAGYPALGFYWLISWARSLAVLFWAVILFNVIIEWRGDYRHPAAGRDTEPSPPEYPVQRLLIHVCWLLWLSAFFIAMILAWSTKPDVFFGVFAFLNRPFSIGKINLSLMGLIFAVLIIFFTHILTRLVKHTLEIRVFAQSDMEPGLKDSIATISVYLMWGIGVITALSVLGVSATSLAVVFGALSIGIGFGLQNIFNNFISGVILLFERPIQVGDAVEIGGIWGEVRKINVRATVVQTFDNASLIIPNSEFISSQVTNWSFKDQSLRRKLDVGVAYGSDVELVRQTLLEIANQTPNVMKKPKPDVIFFDHADSALIFTLRYWTTVKDYYTTWTDIRFAIDRLFRERDIEIAFPQRDVHIRSVVKDKDAVDDFEQEDQL